MQLKGLATGIGSLPYEEAAAAVDLIFRYVPQIPFWPQLPLRDKREGMIAQFSQNLPCLKVDKDGLTFNQSCQEKELELFYEHLLASDYEYFRITPEFSQGLYEFYNALKRGKDGIEFIKLQLAGPLTFAAGINDERGSALLNNPVFMQAITKGLAMKGLWQIKLFREFGKQMIIFLDEPYLGCFGSAFTPVNREDVVSALAEVSHALKSEGAFVGVHCCGNTDWSILADIGSIDIISFDACGFMEKFVLYAESLKFFLERGGIICWGIVPTQNFSGEENVGDLARRLKEGISVLVNKGISYENIINNLIISPACGLGTFSPHKAEKIFSLLSELSASLREYL